MRRRDRGLRAARAPRARDQRGARSCVDPAPDAEGVIEPAVLRWRAEAMLDEVGRLRADGAPGVAFTAYRADALVNELIAFQSQVERAAQANPSTGALPIIMGARRCIARAELIVLDLLTEHTFS